MDDAVDGAPPEIVAVLEPVLRVALRDTPPAVADQITRGLCAHYALPMVSELEFVLRSKFTLARARQLLFTPSVDAMRFYPLLLCAPPTGCETKHPQLKLQRIHLSLFFMVHVHSVPLGHAFVLGDGLLTLASLVRDENMFARSQAVQSFLQLTVAEKVGKCSDRTGWDWFTPPLDGDTRAAALHRKMLALGSTPFLLNLLANHGAATYPDGSFDCLRLFAFWVGWARALYSAPPTHVQLSRSMLTTLSTWADAPGVAAEEATLASQLYDDFNRFGAFDDDDDVASVGGADGGAGATTPSLSLSGLAIEGGSSSAEDAAAERALELELEGAEDFIAASAFAGRKRGYVFMSAAEGLGYYRDCARARSERRTRALEPELGLKPKLEPVSPAAVAAAVPPTPPTASASAKRAAAVAAVGDNDDDEEAVAPPVVLTASQAALEANHIADLILQRGRKKSALPSTMTAKVSASGAPPTVATAAATGTGQTKKKKKVKVKAKSAAKVKVKKKKGKKKDKAGKSMNSFADEQLPDWMA